VPYCIVVGEVGACSLKIRWKAKSVFIAVLFGHCH
jgi:hypothetical protein